jgi:hypothetical protein
VEAGGEVRLLEQAEAAAGAPDRCDHLGACRAARQVRLDVEPLAAVDVAGLEGGQLLAVGMVGHEGYSWRAPSGAGRVGNTVSPGWGGRGL